MSHFDAIISGCGPVGATLANLLAAQGLQVCVVEKYREIYDKPRAIAFDWEGMRVLQFCGVAHELSPGTKPHPGTDFRGIDGQLIKVFDPLPPPWDLGWPPTLTFVQPEMERILRDALDQRANVTVRFGQRVSGFEDHGDRVSVTITDMETGADETLSGDFLVGCDGANSDIRTALGFGLEDYGFDENWLVVDAHQLRETELPNKTTQYCWPSRPTTFLIGPGTLRRWELKIMPGETPEEFTDEARIREVMAPYADMGAFDIWRSATYRFNARVGLEWRQGRVLLAGDAVHQTPPFLGQGLCAGIRDAANLAWKLVHIQRTGFNDGLLESYQAERRPHVGTLIQHAKDFGAIIGELDEARARQRDAELSAQLESGQMETTRQGFIPGLEFGLIDPALADASAERVAGTLMVQPRVLDTDGAAVLLDDLAPMEFLFITDSAKNQRWMDEVADIWSRISGRRMVISTDGPPEPARTEAGIEYLADVEGSISRWCDRTGASAVIVRPDRYVYAAVASQADLTTKVTDLAEKLLPA